ncbi:MAG: MFS transporter [bacterium]|nr:MFS transporter [bacterium]
MKKADQASKIDLIPGLRWQLPVVLLFTVLISYFDRMNITYAIAKIGGEYGWSTKEIGNYGGLLMSIFYVGYGLANMFLSPLGAKFGPRKSLLVIIVLFSLFTVLSAPFAMIFTVFVFVRICLGLSEGIHFPMLNILTRNWFPAHERSRANSIWLLGLFLSMVLAPFIVVPIIEHLGWRTMFYILGVAGMAISIPLVFFLVKDSPEKSPAITRKELDYIQSGMEAEEPATKTVWEGYRSFFRKPAYWVAMLAGICNNMVAFGLMSWLPTYFTEGRGIPFSSLTWATSIPYSMSLVGIMLWSFVGDKTNKRAYLAGAGFLGAGICAYFATTAVSIYAAVAIFTLTIFIKVTYACNEFAIIQRIVPKQNLAAGVGFYNGFAMMLGGGIGPVIVGQVLAATGSYESAILSITFLCAIGGAIMFVLGRMIKY